MALRRILGSRWLKIPVFRNRAEDGGIKVHDGPAFDERVSRGEGNLDLGYAPGRDACIGDLSDQTRIRFIRHQQANQQNGKRDIPEKNATDCADNWDIMPTLGTSRK